MNRTSADIEAEVEASRSQLDRDVDALKSKMTPGQMFDEAARMMGGTGQQVASKFAEQAKANPMPLAVMGLGLAWLMMSNNRQQTGGYGSYSGEVRSFAPGAEYGAEWDGSAYDGASHSGSTGAGLKEKVQGVGDKAAGMLSDAKEKLAGGAHSVGDGGRNAMHHVGSAAGAVRQRAAQAGQQAQQTFIQTLESEPLLIAGLGLIVGAAIGAAIPATAAENRVMGDARDKVMSKGKEVAQQGLQQASTVAQAAYGAAKSEVKSASGQDGDLSEPVDSPVRSGVEPGREQTQGPSH
ncbi:DUF3618 domain-containing protein [Phenylobacterium sp.]|jgi:hypothetical protein|uniref:DUF3618 domain-containing protein n=1 Tax=Phenylobacterium sp. TaxID=1871053 RepID=UPI002F9423EB